MNRWYIALFCLVSFALVSCNRTESKISSLDTEMTLAEQDTTSLDKADLESLEAQLEQLQSDLEANRSKYTDEQIREVGKLQGRYAALALKKGMKDLNESLKDAGNQLDVFIEGIQQ